LDGVIDPAEIVSAGSMTPLKFRIEIFEFFHNFVRKILVVSAGSMTPLKLFRQDGNHFGGVNDPAETISVGPMT
jgi:hypothetical protein